MLAFAAHPKLGDKAAVQPSVSIGGKHAAASSQEQAQIVNAPDKQIADLMLWNRKYESKFGHVFLLCASGKGAVEVLLTLKQRCAIWHPSAENRNG
jgi:2-oxo-4-hydroxy-4-carboxy--5-ureidoimidazoline (OHCU) decarboxylase